jgi:hypothetical protein
MKLPQERCGRGSSGTLVACSSALNDDGALAIGQLSHAWLSGQLARAWGNDRFSAPEPREGIALGAQQHDIGWARFDLEPRFNPESGLPRTFLELTAEEHLAIWCGAPELVSVRAPAKR